MRSPDVRRAGLVLLLLFALGIGGCSSSKRADQPKPSPPVETPAGHLEGALTGTGTITHTDIEGGFFAIKGDDGVMYDPKSLPEAFRVDGLRVRYTIKVQEGAAGIHMVGPIVDVIDIARE
jgi:hypothetical protein